MLKKIVKKRGDLPKLCKGVLFIGLSMGAAAQNALPSVPAPSPTGQPGQYTPLTEVPNACLGESHEEYSRKIEKEFLDKYKEEYGKQGHPLAVTIEMPGAFQNAAETYFQSPQATEDERTLWMAIDQIVEPQATQATHEKAADFYMTAEQGKEARGMMRIAAYAHRLGFKVEFVDENGLFSPDFNPEEIKRRNVAMGRRDAQLAVGQHGGVVAINGADHDTMIVSTIDSLPMEMEKNGASCPAFDLTPDEGSRAGEIRVENAGQMMRALKGEEGRKGAYGRAKPRGGEEAGRAGELSK